MCSINGFVSLKRITNRFKRNDKIKDIIVKGEDRGKDSFGYATFNYDLTVNKCSKYIDKPSNILNKEFKLDETVKILLNNNRAEPTTEFVKNKKLCDVQPFNYGKWWVVHNGIIANDKELIEKYNLKIDTKIDSAVIGGVLEHGSGTIKERLDELVGSYALAFYKEGTDTLYLATNYKPLSLLYDRIEKTLYFSSIENYMKDKSIQNIISDENFSEVPPYTLLSINIFTGKIIEQSLYTEKINKKKALVCASSGMDSTVAATWAVNQGYETTLLHFNYHCRAEQKENESIKKIAERLGCKLVEVTTDFFRDVIKGSRLTGTNDQIIKEGEKGAELAYEWVPARNLIFMSIAAGYAEAHGIDYIVLGGNLEESGSYPDNELIFQTKFNDILPYSLNLQSRVQVLTPVANLMKHEIVKLGIELNAPLDLTWSCYENGSSHCGLCGPCYMRKTAFEMNSIPEVIDYLN